MLLLLQVVRFKKELTCKYKIYFVSLYMNILETEILQTSGIYVVFNIKNGKKYIGSSKNIFQRLQKHRSLLRNNKHENSYLQNAWNKYGEIYFHYSILEFCKDEELTIKEQEWINNCNPEYNLTREVVRNILSKESRLKQSQTRKDLFRLGILIPYKIRKVDQFDLEGNFLKRWNMIKQASRELNIAQSTIHRVLNGTYKQGCGYIWKYVSEEDLIKLGEFMETPEVDNHELSADLNVQ